MLKLIYSANRLLELGFVPYSTINVSKNNHIKIYELNHSVLVPKFLLFLLMYSIQYLILSS